MWNKPTILAVLALSVAGVAIGDAKPAKKFPYLSDALNAPCGKTEFEWRCATQGFVVSGPIKLTETFDLVELTAKPGPTALTVKAVVKLRDGVKPPTGSLRGFFGTIVPAVAPMIQSRFGDGRGPAKAFDRRKDLIIEVYLGDNNVLTCGMTSHDWHVE